MHELSIAMALVEQLKTAAEREKALRITSVTISVGAISGADPDALEFAFKTAAEESPAAGAALVIEKIPARVHCRACGKDGEPRAHLIACRYCESTDIELTGGRELMLKNMEIETD